MLSKKFRLELFLFGLGLGLLSTGIILGLNFSFSYRNKFYPGVHIDNNLVAGLTREEALNLLKNKSENINNFQVKLSVDDISIASSSASLDIHRDYSLAIENAYNFSRKRFFLYKIYSIWKSQEQKPNFNSQVSFDEKKAKTLVKELAKKVDTNYDFPTAKLRYSGSVGSLNINPGKTGRSLEVESTVALILDRAKEEDLDLQAKVASKGAQLNLDQLQAARTRAEKLVNKSLILKADDFSKQINDQELVTLLNFPDGIYEEKLNKLVSNLSQDIKREPASAVFEYDKETLRVIKFVAPQDGLKLKQEETKTQIKDFIQEIDEQNCQENNCYNSAQFLEKELALEKTSPKITLENTNDLGIKELIGFGDSNYEHSIPNRIHNVAHAAKLINNSIIAPGEEFSLVKTLGPVNQATGFKSAYVIKEGSTVLGDGGGVCQVSTTVFRAVLNAGLDITRRLPHSYRVSYYELNSKPGVDATVYTGNVDLRFINDTPGHILLHTETDSDALYMTVKLYGTSDGRTAEIVDHKTYGYTSPPATQYIPTADLPTGVTRRVENAIPGIKAEFTNVIKDKDGNIISEKKYFSNYQAWGAKYLIGI